MTQCVIVIVVKNTFESGVRCNGIMVYEQKIVRCGTEGFLGRRAESCNTKKVSNSS